MFSSVRRVFSAGTFRSTFVWQFGPAFLCHVLIVGSFRYMRVYIWHLYTLCIGLPYIRYGLFINVCVISPLCHVSAVGLFIICVCVYIYIYIYICVCVCVHIHLLNRCCVTL